MARRGMALSVLGLSPGGAWNDTSHQQALMKRIRGTLKVMPYLIAVLRPLLSITSLRKFMLRDEMEHGERMTAAEVRSMLHHALNCTIAQEFLHDGIPQVERLPADNTTPVRVVWGGCDKVLTFNEFGQPFLDRLGLKTHGVLPGCGHNPMYDDPAGVADVILEFVRSVEGGRA
jgi:pimeloyl-ACP methyl ester carboxylesterase